MPSIPCIATANIYIVIASKREARVLFWITSPDKQVPRWSANILFHGTHVTNSLQTKFWQLLCARKVLLSKDLFCIDDDIYLFTFPALLSTYPRTKKEALDGEIVDDEEEEEKCHEIEKREEIQSSRKNKSIFSALQKANQVGGG